METVIRKGTLAFCGLGCLGLITEDEPQEITYEDGNKSVAWVGIHLTDKVCAIGSGWSSRSPVVVGHTDIGWFHTGVSPSLTESEEEYEPDFGWCDVEGCDNEGANGGGCWRETGYWTVCSKHSSQHRAGRPQPKMKQSAIDREKGRGTDGVLGHNSVIKDYLTTTAVMPSCEGNCGMNYCDENGCIERKRILVEPLATPDVSRQSELLFAFIKAIKEEFADQNWDYLDFIADRVIGKQ